MPIHNSEIPSFQIGPVPKDNVPRRYKDAPTTVSKYGYVLEWCPTHPTADWGAVHQHRLVMECHLGRFLTKLEKVHHKDHVRHHNDVDNLKLYSTQAEHMKAHWAGKGKNDPELIERVRQAAADPTKKKIDLGLGYTMIDTICRENDIVWIPGGKRGTYYHKLSDEKVREALQGRTTIQAAQYLQCSLQTLYNRFDHLLTKRTKPGYLDQFREDILRMTYKERRTREEVAAMYGVSDFCVSKSIRRWSEQDAKLGGPALPEAPRNRPGPKPGRTAQRREQWRRERA